MAPFKISEIRLTDQLKYPLYNISQDGNDNAKND